MLIGITAALIVAIGLGAFVILYAATAVTRRSVDMDPSLDEQPLERWSTPAQNGGINSPAQWRLS